MALDLQAALRPALASEVAEWVEGLARETLGRRAALVAAVEADKGMTGAVEGATGSFTANALTHTVGEAEVSQKSIASVTGPRRARSKPGRYRVVAVAAAIGVVLGAAVSLTRLGATATSSAVAEPDVSRASPATDVPSSRPVVAPSATAEAATSEAPRASAAPTATNVAVDSARAHPQHAPATNKPGGVCPPTTVDPTTGKITFNRKCLQTKGR